MQAFICWQRAVKIMKPQYGHVTNMADALQPKTMQCGVPNYFLSDYVALSI
jgi:hypothetical protein